jgi:hypothetical protein
VFVCGFKGFCFCVSVFVMLFAFVSLFVDPLYGGGRGFCQSCFWVLFLFPCLS